MRTAARRRPRSRRRLANGDADDWGVCFRYPRAGALFVLTLGTQQFAIASANECKAALYETDGSAAQIVRFPAVIGAPFSNRSSAMQGKCSRLRARRTHGWRCLTAGILFGQLVKGWSRPAPVHRAPEPSGGIGACIAIAIKWQLRRMGVDRWRLFGRDTVLICPVRRMACHPSEARRVWPTAKSSSG